MLKAIHLGTLFNCSVLAMVLLAAGRIYEIFLPWYIWLPDNVFSYVVLVTNHFPDFVSSSVDSQTTKSVSASNYFSLLITMLVTWSYSTTGGLRSVVRTDMSQLLLMFVGTISFAVILYLNATSSQLGLREVLNESYGKVKASDLLSLFNNELGIFALLVIGIQWIAQVNSDGSGYLAQRILACRSESEAQKACLIFTVTQIVIRSFFWIIIGVSLLILYPANSNGGSLDVSYRELTYVLGMKDYLPVGLAGIMLTAMLAALASTIDTHLNWGSSYWTNDLYHRGLCDRILKRVPSDSELVFVARIANLVILVLAVTIAVNISSIQKAWEFSLLFGSGFGLVLMLRWLWWRVTVYCEIAAGVGSIMTIFFVYDIESSIALLSVFAISSILVVFFAFFGPREDEETLLKFYRMIKPVGFWGPIAQKCGDSASLSLNKLKSDILKVFSLVFLIFGSYILLVKTFF